MILSYLPDRDRLLPFSAAGSKFLARISKRFRALRNRWLYLISYQENKITCLGEPEVFQVEPTNHCNLKCPMCPHDLVTRKLCFMPIDNFRKIIDQVRLYFDRTRLHNKGESLIHKGIEKFVSCSRGLAIHTTQSTNASALTPASGKQILDAGLNSLLTSFDGASKGAYKYFCVGAKYENVLKKVKSFLR
jgi:MoaA/NifB/PqqE/SkfB family radical SAM enzyme